MHNNDHISAGKVFILYGTVKAVAPDGTERILHPGDIVYRDERIVTGPDGMISITLDQTGQPTLDLGRLREVTLNEIDDSKLTTTHSARNNDNEVVDENHAIETDISSHMADNDDGGSHPFVTFIDPNPEVIPDAGCETTGINRNFLDPDPVDRPIHLETDTEPIIVAAVPIVPVEPPTPSYHVPPATPPIEPPTTPPVEPPVEPPANAMPKIGSYIGVVNEDDLPEGSDSSKESTTIQGDLDDLDFTPGDGVHTITIDGYDLVLDGSGDSVTIDGSQGTLVFHDDGTWNYTVTENSDHPTDQDQLDDVFNFTIADEDGDSAGGSLTLGLIDDTPHLSGTVVNPSVEEEALDNNLSQGIQELDDDNDPATGDAEDGADIYTVSGSLTSAVSFGADQGDGSGFTFSRMDPLICQFFSSGGDLLNYTVTTTATGQLLTATATDGSGDSRVVFTLSLSENGAYTFTLNDQLDHSPVISGENNMIIDFSDVIEATDGDGDTVLIGNLANPNDPPPFAVTIVDDVPEVHQVGYQFFFDYENAGYDNIFGVYELDDNGQPINPHIIVNSTDEFQDHDGDELVYSSTSGIDGIFLIQNGADNLGRDLQDSEIQLDFHPDSEDGYYTLQYWDGNNWQDYGPQRIFFMNTNFNQPDPNTSAGPDPDHFAEISSDRSDGAYAGQPLDPALGEHTITSVPIAPDSDPSNIHYIGVEDIWGGAADWDYNDATGFAVAGLGVRESALAGSPGEFDPNVNEDNTRLEGNFLDDGNIVPGADEIVTLTVNNQNLSLDNDGNDFIEIVSHNSYGGDLGRLIITDNGDWSYTLEHTSPDHTIPDDPIANDGNGDGLEFNDVVQDVFNIAVSDADGDTVNLPLTINIYDGEDTDTGPNPVAQPLAAEPDAAVATGPNDASSASEITTTEAVDLLVAPESQPASVSATGTEAVTTPDESTIGSSSVIDASDYSVQVTAADSVEDHSPLFSDDLETTDIDTTAQELELVADDQSLDQLVAPPQTII